MKYSLEQYKTLAERFNAMSFLQKIMTIKQQDIFILEVDNYSNFFLRLDDNEAMQNVIFRYIMPCSTYCKNRGATGFFLRRNSLTYPLMEEYKNICKYYRNKVVSSISSARNKVRFREGNNGSKIYSAYLRNKYAKTEDIYKFISNKYPEIIPYLGARNSEDLENKINIFASY